MRTFIILVSTISLLTSCASLYVPNMVNTPLLTEKGDGNLTVGIGSNGTDIQAAYAPVEHLGVMLNSSFGYSNSSESQNYHKHSFFEAGAGYSLPFGSTFVFEAYAGLGHSKSNSISDQGSNSTIDKVDGNYFRYFLQPSLGLKKEGFEASWSLRSVFIDAYQFTKDNNPEVYSAQAMLLEPVLTFRFGAQAFKFQTQLGMSLPLLEPTPSFNYRPFMLSVGGCYRF